MEPPPFHHQHHHSRYVLLPSPTPPSFSTDHRNFYLPPPPPPPPPGPPPPLPQPYLPPPPPPRQSDFTFLSHRRSPPPRIFDHRSPFNHDHRPHLRIPQQITTNPFPNPESRVSLDFDRDPPNHHHRLFNNQIPLSSHYRTTSDNNYRHALDDGRFIRSTTTAAADDDINDDFIDAFKNYHTNEDFLLRRPGGGSDNNKYYRSSQDRYGMKNSSGSFSFDDEFKFDGSKRDFGGSNLGNFVPFRDSILDSDRLLNNRDENRRWVVQGRSSSRELYDHSAESENYEYGDGDGVRDGSLRRVSNIYDSDRVNYKSSREGNQEFVHSPRKQVQKKSALLRIQFGNKHHNRNRNEQRFPAARSENSNYPSSSSSTFRNRGPLVNSNNRMEEERARSPVELDVSFKSNALVAKAIVVSSGLEIESDRNITPRDRKITKITVPERDFRHSPPTKLNEGHLKSESSSYTLESPSISHKDSKQSGNNVIDSNGGAQPSTIGTIDSPGNNTLIEPVSNKGGNAVNSDGTSPLRIRKKKKVTGSLSRESRSQQVKNYVEPVKTERPRNCPPAASQPDEDYMHSEEKTPSSSLVLEHNFGLQPSPNEVTALLEHSKVDKSPGAMVSEKDCTDIDSGNRNHSTSLLGSSTPLEAKIAEVTVIADRSVAFHNYLNPDNCPGEPLVSLQNGSVKGSPEAKLSLGGSVDTDLSSPGGIKMCEGPANLYSSFYDLQNASCSEDRLIKDQLKYTDSVIDAVDTGSEFNQATLLLESTAVERFPRAIFSVEGNAIVGSSNAEETKMHDGVCDANYSTHYETTTSGYDNVLTNSQWKTPVSKISSFVDNNNASCPHDTILFLENGPMEEPPEARMSVGGNLHVGFSEGYTPKKRKVRDELSGLSSPSTSDICVNAVNIVHDTALSFPVNNLNSEEEEKEEVMHSGAWNFGAGSQPCTYKDSIVHENSSTEGSSDNQLSVNGCSSVGQNGTYPKYIKKRKAFAPISRSPMLSETWVEPVSAGSFTFNVELPSDSMMQSEDRVVMSKIDTLCSAQLPPCLEPTIELLGNTEPGATFDTMVLVGEDSTGSVAKLEQESPCPAGLGSEQKEKGCPVNTTKNHQIDILDMERGGSGEIVAASKTAEECRMPLIETDQHINLVETQAHNTDLRQPVTDMECDSSLLVKDNLPSDLNCLPSCTDANCVSTANLLDETVEYVPDKLLDTGSPEASLTVTRSLGQILNEKDGEDVRKQDEKPVFEGSSLYSLNAPFQKITGYKKSDLAAASVHSINSNPGPRDASKTTNSLNFMSRGLNLGKNQPNSTVPRVFRGHSSLNKTMPSSHIAKPRTWHRTGDPSASSLPGKNSHPYPIPPQGQTPRKIGKVQSVSYVRKGNSLVRKPSPAAAAAPNVSHASSSSVYQLNPKGIDEMKKKANVQSRVGVSNPPSSLRTELNAPLERPNTPPLPCNTKLSNVTTISSGDYSSSPLADPPQDGCSVTESDCLKLKENIIMPSLSEDAPNSSGNHENQIDQINNFECQSVQDDGNSVSIETRKIVYVKRKSNQLVAASSSSDQSVQNVDKVESLSNDGYYKRRKNQLIRKSSDVLQNASLPDDCLNSMERRASQVTASSSSRRQSVKGLAKTYRPSKFSLVWNLRDAESLKKENTVLRQVWPHLFPWKRALHKRSFTHRSVSISNYNSVSTISRKLLFSRKRETIYTRSTRGFSLRKSKVLSVGGSSLKWSKSIERSSKKANEEATLAVAAAEKKKREQNGAIAVTAGTKNRNHSSRKSVNSVELRPGERIFRIGSVRYKMDPTRRTLQRISDEKFPCSAVLQSAKDVKTSSVPKRLLIGNDEYVRIGNGNQLVRDPKKRTRTLASEKVRWSLYTARLRLAKKRTYCQFFTRFGKCNKGDGKCPYIHDPSKIAVCTKFLKGSCSDPYCKLTHKVIPERMQDCSYFLQGLCSNESCPYRHVNVNPNASTCEGFLRGYCADGNECPKKHSYICPVFEATGVCPQGSKCKLHHPKNRKKGKKRKQPCREEKNTRGRYFGCRHIDTSQCRTAASEKHSAKDDDDIFYQGGRLADYIHLDVSDEEAREIKNPITEQSCDDGDQAYIPLDVDELIKPVSIMNKNLTAESSSAWNRFNEKTTGNFSEEPCCK